MTILPTLSVFWGNVSVAKNGAGNKAPEFTLANSDSKTISLSDYNVKIAAMER
jgi:hypothetical protein